MKDEPQSLYPEGTRVASVNPWVLILFSLIFAVIFFVIGSVFRHYVWVGA